MESYTQRDPSAAVGAALRRHDPYSPVSVASPHFATLPDGKAAADLDGVYAETISPPHRSASHSSHDDHTTTAPHAHQTTGFHTPARSDDTAVGDPSAAPDAALMHMASLPYHAAIYAEHAAHSAWADVYWADLDPEDDAGPVPDGEPPAYTQALFDIVRDGAELPPAAAAMHKKIDRKRRQRKRRLLRHKERQRAKRDAAAGGAAVDHDSDDATSSAASSCSTSDADADEWEIPIAAPPATARPPVPPKPELTAAQPAIPLPRSMRSPVSPVAASPTFPSRAVIPEAERSATPAEAAAKKSAAKKPTKPEWQVVGGKSAAAQAAPAKPLQQQQSAVGPSPVARNPFELLAQAEKPRRPTKEPPVASTKGESLKQDETCLKQACLKQAETKAASKGESKPTEAKVQPRQDAAKPRAPEDKKKKARAPSDEFDDLLRQLETATDRNTARPKPRQPTGMDDEPIADMFHALAAADPSVAPLSAAIRRAESRRGQPGPRYAALAPLEQFCGVASSKAGLRAMCHLELAGPCMELQDAEQAAVHARAAVELAQTIGDQPLVAKAHLRVGKALEACGDAVPCMQAIEAAVDSNRSTVAAQPRFLVHCLTCYGSAADLVGRPDVALACFERATTIARPLNDRRLEAEVAVYRAGSLIAHGAFQQAASLLMDVVKAGTIKEPTTAVRCLQQLAQAMFITGMDEWEPILLGYAERYDAAGDVSSAGHVYGLLGQYAWCSHDGKKCLEYHQKELRAFSAPPCHYRLCDALHNVGLAYTLLGQHAKAVAKHALESEQAKATAEPLGEAKALTAKGYADLCAGDVRGAMKAAMAAVSLIDAVPAEQRERYMVRLTCYEAEWKVLDLLEAIHITTGNHALAFRVADRKHVAELHRLLKRPMSPTVSPRLASLFHADALLQRCRAAGADAVVMYSFAWNDAASDMLIYTYDGPTDTVAAERVPFPLRTLALLAAQQSNFRRAVVGDALDTILIPHRLARLIDEASRREHAELLALPAVTASGGLPAAWLAALYDDLFRPVASRLEGRERILFAVDGLLSTVPFHALVASADAPPLIELHTVAICPSVSCFVALEEATTTADSAPTTIATAAVADTAADLAATVAECRAASVVVVPWEVVAETREPFIGAVAVADRATSCSSNELTTIRDACSPRFTVPIADILKRSDNNGTAHDSTAILQHVGCASSRIVHDVSVPPYASFFLMGFTRVLRSLSPAHAVLAPFLSAHWSGHKPSPASFRTVCRDRHRDGDDSWHFAVLTGAL